MDNTTMPRTKQVRKRSTRVGYKKASSVSIINGSDSAASRTNLQQLLATEFDSQDHFKEAFLTYHNDKIKEHEESYKRSRDYIKTLISKLKKDLASYAALRIHSNEIQNLIPDENNDPNIAAPANVQRTRSSRADRFEFLKPKVPSKIRSRSNSTSSSHSSRKRSLSTPAADTRCPEVYKTPMFSSTLRLQSAGTITPKIFSNTPMSVMRRPAMGELAVSMSGSPLMVGPVSRDDFPTVNVPLNDGRIFSILPEPGAPPPDLPDFDETTKEYLKTLRAHLEFLAPSAP